MKNSTEFKVQNFLPQESLSIGNQLHRLLRASIIEGQLLPGQIISEIEMSKRFSISRQPVREAFIKLAEESLVEVRPQRGTYVRRISVPAVMTARFVRATRPFGWWGRYAALLGEADRREHRRDLGAVPFVMLAQVTLFLCSMQVVLHDLAGAAASGALCLAASVAVWRIWGRYL